MPPKQKSKGEQKAKASKTAVDVIDALPAGTDAEGKPLVVTFTEMKAWAARMEELADVIASCKAA